MKKIIFLCFILNGLSSCNRGQDKKEASRSAVKPEKVKSIQKTESIESKSLFSDIKQLYEKIEKNKLVEENTELIDSALRKIGEFKMKYPNSSKMNEVNGIRYLAENKRDPFPCWKKLNVQYTHFETNIDYHFEYGDYLISFPFRCSQFEVMIDEVEGDAKEKPTSGFHIKLVKDYKYKSTLIPRDCVFYMAWNNFVNEAKYITRLECPVDFMIRGEKLEAGRYFTKNALNPESISIEY